VGISLFVLVQSKQVYPDLLLARMFFSVGGAATSTMVTAVLPSMIMPTSSSKEAPITIPTEPANSTATPTPPPQSRASAPSQIAGIVGLFTGCGALLALTAFLPLPAWLQRNGDTPGAALQQSYHTVGSIAIVVAIVCSIGLARLAGEENKSWRAIVGHKENNSTGISTSSEEGVTIQPSYWSLVRDGVILGFTDTDIALGYLGGFVARASSVGISLFVPLFVNAYFNSREVDCGPGHHADKACVRGYKVAAMLTGVSQLIALICAPLFGVVDGLAVIRRLPFSATLLLAALAGIAGNVLFANIHNPDPRSAGAGILGIVALLGVSQIGAIVCCLSSLARGIGGGGSGSTQTLQNPAEEDGDDDRGVEAHPSSETSPLLSSQPSASTPLTSRHHLKGTIAGLYSLFGGAGILLLTKLGGALFDSTAPGSPFYLLAGFNGVLLVAVVVLGSLRMMRP